MSIALFYSYLISFIRHVLFYLIKLHFIVSFQESEKEETTKSHRNWKLKFGSWTKDSSLKYSNGWDIAFIAVTSEGAVLLISYDAWCSEEMCVLLQHGSRPHWRSGPELMHSRCRGFWWEFIFSLFSCSSWTFCPFFHEPKRTCCFQLSTTALVWWIFYLYSQQMQSSEKTSARRRLSQLFRRRRETAPV